MAAKKNTSHTTTRMAHKVPKRKLAKTANRPSEASTPVIARIAHRVVEWRASRTI
jgi:hypothetical protein